MIGSSAQQDGEGPVKASEMTGEAKSIAPIGRGEQEPKAHSAGADDADDANDANADADADSDESDDATESGSSSGKGTNSAHKSLIHASGGLLASAPEEQSQKYIIDEQGKKKYTIKRKYEKNPKGKKFKKKELGPSAVRLWYIIKEVFYSPYSKPFQSFPFHSFVNQTRFVGGEPIDLVYVRSNLDNYERHPEQFLIDMSRIFDTALLHEPTSSTNHQYAERLKFYVEGRFYAHFKCDFRPHHLGRARKTMAEQDLDPRFDIQSKPSGPISGSKYVTAPSASSPRATSAAQSSFQASLDMPTSKLEAHVPAAAAGLKASSSSASKAGPEPKKKMKEKSSVTTGAAVQSTKPSRDASASLPELVIDTPSAVPKAQTVIASIITSSAATSPTSGGQSPKQPRSQAETEALIARLESAEGAADDLVKERIAKLIAENAALDSEPGADPVALSTPFVTSDGAFHVDSLGKLTDDTLCHSERYLYPEGFATRTTLRLCIVPRSAAASRESASQPAPFIDVEVTSKISSGGDAMEDDNNDQQVFTLDIDGQGPLIHGDSPRSVWVKLLESGEQVLALLGGRLRRCRAVFNRLCCLPVAEAFLEQVPPSGPSGQMYYKAIKAPMWLREVHSRLVDGTYDSEYDFAWDMRLIFRNCMEFNQARSRLHRDAEEMMHAFDGLFCMWVLNVQDRSLGDTAKGPWDDWQHLRYFDTVPANTCHETQVVVPEADLVTCSMCEDMYSLAALGLDAPPPSAAKWQCARCVLASASEALEPLRPASKANTSGKTGVITHSFAPYSRDEMGLHTYQPCPELSSGWCQARRLNRLGLKNAYLSPLGYEVDSRDAVAAQMEFEKTVDQTLLADRENEYQIYQEMKQKKGRQKKTSISPTKRSMRLKRGEATPESSSAAAEGDISKNDSGIDPKEAAVDADEDDALVRGKFADYSAAAAAESDTVWCVETLPERFAGTAEDGDTGKARIRKRGRHFELDLSLLPGAGLFGLDCSDIRSLLESRVNLDSCPKYQSDFAERARKEVLNDILSERARSNAQKEAQECLQQTVSGERWQFEKARRMYRMQGHDKLIHTVRVKQERADAADLKDQASAIEGDTMSSSTRASGLPKDFESLLPEGVSAEEGEALLAVWDFLDAFRTSIGEPTISFIELLSAIQPQDINRSSVGQVTFDEVCCTLSRGLLKEMRSYISYGAAVMTSEKEFAWLDMLQAKPLNMLTWPFIAMTIIQAHSFMQDFSSAYQLHHQLLTKSSAAEASAADAMRILNFSSGAGDCAMRDVMCLLLGHPLIPHLIKAEDASKHEHILYNEMLALKKEYLDKKCSHALNAQSVNGACDAGSSSGISDLCLRIEATFASAKERYAESSAAHWIAGEISTWAKRIRERGDTHAHSNSETASDHMLQSAVLTSLSAAESAKMHKEELTTKERDQFHSRSGHYLNPFLFGDFPAFYGLKKSSESDAAAVLNLKAEDFLVAADDGLLRARIEAHAALEETLYLLRKSEPAAWSRRERLTVLRTLVDRCAQTPSHRQFVSKMQTNSSTVLRHLHDVAARPTGEVPEFETAKVNPRSATRCHYSGAEARLLDPAAVWVYVPLWLQQPPPPYVREGYVAERATSRELLDVDMALNRDACWEHTEAKPDSSSETGSRSRASRANASSTSSTRTKKGAEQRPVALLNAALLVASAREVALRERARHEERCEAMVKQWGTGTFTAMRNCDSLNAECLKVHYATKRAAPLGYDRDGNQYWLLGVQESMSLRPLGSYLNPLSVKADPAVLVKTPSGRWGYAIGAVAENLTNRLSTEIACERLCRMTLIERLQVARRKLFCYSHRLKPLQQDWLRLRMGLEAQIQAFNTPRDMPLGDQLKAVESHHAKCIEARSIVHFAALYRDERAKDLVGNDVFDLNPVAGWLRGDVLCNIRNLHSSTTACRLLAEPGLYRKYQDVMRRSRYWTNMAAVAAVRLKADGESQHSSTALVNVGRAHTQGSGGGHPVALPSSNGPANTPRVALALAPIPAPCPAPIPAPVAPPVPAPPPSLDASSQIASDSASGEAETSSVENVSPAALEPPSHPNSPIQAAPNMEKDSPKVASPLSGCRGSPSRGSPSGNSSPKLAGKLVHIQGRNSPLIVQRPLSTSSTQDIISKSRQIVEQLNRDALRSPCKSSDPRQPSPSPVGTDSPMAQRIIQSPSQPRTQTNSPLMTETKDAPARSNDSSNGSNDKMNTALPPLTSNLVQEPQSSLPQPPQERNGTEGVFKQPHAQSDSSATSQSGGAPPGAPPPPGAAPSSGPQTLQQAMVAYLSDANWAKGPLPAKILYGRNKVIEQLHLHTKEVLRVYQSGKDAAAFMDVSQAGISLCCSGRKVDAYGFKWRFYDGPLLDFNALERFQTSREKLRELASARMKRPPPADTSTETQRKVAHEVSKLEQLKRLSSQAPAAPAKPPANNSNKVGGSLPSGAWVPPFRHAPPGAASLRKVLPHMCISKSILHPKMLKLKAELMCLVYAIPDVLVRWPCDSEGCDDEQLGARAEGEKAGGGGGGAKVRNEGEGDEKAVDAKGILKEGVEVKMEMAEAVKSEGSGIDDDKDRATKTEHGNEDARSPSAVSAQPETAVAVSSPKNGVQVPAARIQADTAAAEGVEKVGKAQREERRRKARDRLLPRVQEAQDASDMMDILLFVESIIPATALLGFDQRKLPCKAQTLAEVAVRLYTLDRSLRYDDFKGMPACLVGEEKPFRPRTNFAPRCLRSPLCVRHLGHEGTCQISRDPKCRIPPLDDSKVLVATSPVPPPGPPPPPLPPPLQTQPQNVAAVQSKTLPVKTAVAAPAPKPQPPKRDREMELHVMAERAAKARRIALMNLGMNMPGKPLERFVEKLQGYIPSPQEITTHEWT